MIQIRFRRQLASRRHRR